MSPELEAITADPSKLEEKLEAWNRRTLLEVLVARTAADVKDAQRLGQLGLIDELLHGLTEDERDTLSEVL